jgi:hypothetical protein
MNKQEVLLAIDQLELQIKQLRKLVLQETEEETTESIFVDVIPYSNERQELPAPPEVVYVEYSEPVKYMTHEDDVRISNDILTRLDFTKWCPAGKDIEYIVVHLKVLPPKEEGMKPYVLYREGIYEVDAYYYDEIADEAILLGTSKQFKIDFLGQENAMYLNKQNIHSYSKGTYEPKKVFIPVI